VGRKGEGRCVECISCMLNDVTSENKETVQQFLCETNGAKPG